VLLPLIGTRAMFVSAGVGVLAVWCAAALLLRAGGAPAAAAVGAGS
jgi:hypothetical protein